MLDKDKGANAGIIVDDEDVIAIAYYQSSAMVKILNKFPEILLVDGTYNVNRVGMPLYCLMLKMASAMVIIAFMLRQHKRIAHTYEGL